MKKNEKAFTLIEILAVIVILGILMIIAVPAVSTYIIGSRKSAYMSTVGAYLETVRSEYEMKYYGSFLYDDEIMIVPVELVELEQGESEETPFGTVVYDKSYIVIVPERKSYQFYANFMDTAGYGVLMLPSNAVVRENLEKFDNSESVMNWSAYSNVYETFVHDGKNYIFCGERTSDNAKKGSTAKILILCKE